MSNKGQTTIEFLVVFLLMLSLFQLVILPATNLSAHAVRDIERLSKAKIEVEKIESAVNSLSALPGEAIVKVPIYLEGGSIITCKESPPNVYLGYKVDIEDDPNNIQENLPILLKSEICKNDTDTDVDTCAGQIEFSEDDFQCAFGIIEGKFNPVAIIELTKISRGAIHAAHFGG